MIRKEIKDNFQNADLISSATPSTSWVMLLIVIPQNLLRKKERKVGENSKYLIVENSDFLTMDRWKIEKFDNEKTGEKIGILGEKSYSFKPHFADLNPFRGRSAWLLPKKPWTSSPDANKYSLW